MARALRFTEFVEYVLVRLYDLDTGEGDLIDAQQIAAELREPVPSTWPFEAVEYLDQIGYATAALAMASAQAVIRPAGRIQVEERQRQANTIAHQYRAEPHNIVVVSGSGHQVSVGNQGPVTQTATDADARDVLLQLLGEIEETIRNEDSISEADRSEYLADVGTARTQVTKREPNRAAITAVLTPLAKVAAIATPVLTILKMLGVG